MPYFDLVPESHNRQAHWNDLIANRRMAHRDERRMLESYAGMMTNEMQVNAAAGYARDFWQEVDRQAIQLREETIGMELMADLMGVATALPIAKTVNAYNIVGRIADDVSVSIDGQKPYSKDHVAYDSDGDPIPVFTAGYGVNWRHAAGLQSVGLDLVLDSQSAKLKVYNERLVDYLLDGDANIVVDGKAAQGLRNHRNTKKINLGSGSGGVNINLTTADTDGLLGFFGQSGALGVTARNNRITAYDVLWVSYEIWANLSRPYLINVNSGTNGVIGGTVLSAVLPFSPVREIRPTYALTGNEFLGYQRQRQAVSPLIGLSTGITALPRSKPNDNYNFQIMGAMGIKVSRDSDGRGGVVYGANLA